MKVMYTSQKKFTTGRTSTVLLCYGTNSLRNVPGHDIQFNDKITGIIGRCTNIAGQKSISFCSHIITGLHIFHTFVHNKDIQDPTPMISKKMKGISNLAEASINFDALDESKKDELLQNMFEKNDDFLQSNDTTNNFMYTQEILGIYNQEDFGMNLN